MTTERINVVAVLRKHSANHLAKANAENQFSEEASELIAVTLAMAELIEACRPAASKDGWDDAGYARFCAALARVGGAP